MLVETKNLSKVYDDKVAVNGLDIQIERGSFTAILGPNGAGKSTTIQMLIGLLQPTSGQIIYAEQAKLGVVFQNSVLDANLTVVENLQIRAKQYKQVATGKVEQLIEQLGLTSFAKQRYGTLSGGQKQRLAIARALAMDPKIIIFDEPTSSLDPELAHEVFSTINELALEGQTMLIVTHQINAIRHFATRVLFLNNGIIEEDGTCDEIFCNTANENLSSFLKMVEFDDLH